MYSVFTFKAGKAVGVWPATNEADAVHLSKLLKDIGMVVYHVADEKLDGFQIDWTDYRKLRDWVDSELEVRGWQS